MNNDKIDVLPDHEGGLRDVYVGGHPVGILIDRQQETIKTLQDRINDLEAKLEAVEETRETEVKP